MIGRLAINLTWAEIGIILIGCTVSFVSGWTMAAVMVKTIGPPQGFGSPR